MAIDTFVDTSGFYAFLVQDDPAHATTAAFVAEAERGKRSLTTTDYVLDETATLLSARGLRAQAGQFLESILDSEAIQVQWCNAAWFAAAKTLFQTHKDKAWSFTDCLSFAVMNELKITNALTKDRDFKQAGLIVLL